MKRKERKKKEEAMEEGNLRQGSEEKSLVTHTLLSVSCAPSWAFEGPSGVFDTCDANALPERKFARILFCHWRLDAARCCTQMTI